MHILPLPFHNMLWLYMYASYLETEPVFAGAEPHVVHGGAVDHHLSHISAGPKHLSVELKK